MTRLFGSWNAALAAAGFAARPSAYSDEQVIDALRADASRRGRPPRLEEWLERPTGTPGAGAVKVHFGSWTAGPRAAGLRITHRRGHCTRERLIAALQRDARRRGRAPTLEEWGRSARGRPTWSTVAGAFGTWNAGLRAAGLALNSGRDKWTPATVLDALRRRERELGRPPTSQDFVRPPASYPNTAIIARKLGSWGAACELLGWNVRQLVIADDTEMLDALRSAAAELGQSCSVRQYVAIAAARHWPGANRIASRFGTWNKAKAAAWLEVHREEHGWSAEQLARALRALARRLGRIPGAKDSDARAPELGCRTAQRSNAGPGTAPGHTRSPLPASPPHGIGRRAPNHALAVLHADAGYFARQSCGRGSMSRDANAIMPTTSLA